MMTTFTYIPIGVIRTPFKLAKGIPIQSAFSDEQGTIELFPQFKEGLKDLDGFSHIILLYHFHQTTEWKPLVRPFLDKEEHGIFAVRAPPRPNPIGLSTVRLEKIEDTTLFVRGVDVIDGTPLLDIKPYVPKFDNFSEATEGWLPKTENKTEPPLADERFSK